MDNVTINKKFDHIIINIRKYFIFKLSLLLSYVIIGKTILTF